MIHVLSEARPVAPDSVPMFADETLSYSFFGNVYVQILLPAASGGVGDLTYTAPATPDLSTVDLMFDDDRRDDLRHDNWQHHDYVHRDG